MYKFGTRKKADKKKWWQIVGCLLAVLLLAAVTSTTSIAATETVWLDTSFGNQGLAGKAFDADFWPSDSALQPDNKIVVAGSGTPTNGSKSTGGWAVARYNSNGSVDTSFGDNGFVFVPTSYQSNSQSVGIQPDGKIVLGGYIRITSPTDSHWRVMRLNPNGTVDTQFGNNGVAQILPNDGGSLVYDLKVQPDGKIVASGDYDFKQVLVRYNTSGTIDTSFADGGIATATSNTTGIYTYYRNILAIQPDSKIVVLGNFEGPSTKNELFLNRLNADGSLDNTFGSSGVIRYAISDHLTPKDVVVKSDGSILVLTDGGNPGRRIVSYKSDGSLNAGFGNNGVFDFSGSESNSLLITADGKIIIGDASFGLRRINANGTVDSGFGTGGYFKPDPYQLTNLSWASTMLLQPTDKVVAVGTLGIFEQDTLRFTPGLTRFQVTSGSVPQPPDPNLASADTGFRPSKDGFGFDIDNPETPELSPESFVQFFGKGVTTTSNGKLTRGARDYYNDVYKTVATGGNCFGISGAAALNFGLMSQPNAGDFALPFSSTYNLKTSPDYNPGGGPRSLRDMLGYYQGVQKGAEGRQLLFDTPNIPVAELNAIKESINGGKPTTVTMWKDAKKVVNKSFQTYLTGHTILAYRYETVNNTVRVYVYDSNDEGNDGHYITFDLGNNSWYYNPDRLGPWGSEVPGGNMALVPVSAYLNKGILPLYDSGTDTIVVPYIAPYITDPSGNATGIVNGQAVNQADGIRLLPTLDSAPGDTEPVSQQFMTTSGKPYKIHLSNDAAVEGPVSIFGNSAYLSVSSLTPVVGSSASIEVGADNKSVTVAADGKVANYTVTLDQEVAGKSLVFTVSGASLNPGEKTTFALVGDTGQLQIKNNGGSKTYTVAMEETGGNDSTLTLSNINLGGNATQTWVPTDWDNLGTTPVNLTTDQNSDGKSVSTTAANAVSINDGNTYTKSKKVTLHLVPVSPTVQMRIDDKPLSKNQKHGPDWQTFSSRKQWQFSGKNGKKTVYVQYKAADGTLSEVYAVSIILDDKKPEIRNVRINNGKPVTNSTTVQVKIGAKDKTSGIQSMKVSDSSDMSNVAWQPYSNSFNWTPDPLTGKRPQVRYVYVQLQDKAGNVSRVRKLAVLLISR